MTDTNEGQVAVQIQLIPESSSERSSTGLCTGSPAVASSGLNVQLPTTSRRRVSDAGPHCVPTPAAESHSSLGASLDGALANPLLPPVLEAANAVVEGESVMQHVHRLSQCADSMTEEGRNGDGFDPVALAVELKTLATEVADVLNQLKVERYQSALALRDLDVLSCENAELSAVVEELVTDVEEMTSLVDQFRKEKVVLLQQIAEKDATITSLSSAAEGTVRVYEGLRAALEERVEECRELTDANAMLEARIQDEVRAQHAANEAAALNAALSITLAQQSAALQELQVAKLIDEEKADRLRVAIFVDSAFERLRYTELWHRCNIERGTLDFEIEELQRRVFAYEQTAKSFPEGFEETVSALRAEALRCSTEAMSLRHTNEGWLSQLLSERFAHQSETLLSEELVSRSHLVSMWSTEYAAIAFIALRLRPAERPPALPSTDFAQSPNMRAAPQSSLPAPVELTTASPCEHLSPAPVRSFCDFGCQTETADEFEPSPARPPSTKPTLETSTACDVAVQPSVERAQPIADAPAAAPTEAYLELEALLRSAHARTTLLEDDLDLKRRDICELQRRLDEMEQVVCAVELEKATAVAEMRNTERLLQAEREERTVALQSLAQQRKLAEDALSHQLVLQQQQKSEAELNLLEARNAVLMAEADLAEATSRIAELETQLNATAAQPSPPHGPPGVDADYVAELFDLLEDTRRDLCISNQRALLLEESRARQAMQHDWILYASQRAFHSAVHRPVPGRK